MLPERLTMYDFLFDTYLTVFGALVVVLVLGAAAGAAGWRLRKKAQALERGLAGTPRLDAKELYEFLHSAVAHELVKGLDAISGKSRATLEDLPKDQLTLRAKQNEIIATADEVIQHANNIMDLYALQQESLQQEMLNIRHLVESALAKLLETYAESLAVRLMPRLIDIEPVLLSRHLTLISVKNVVHNAIKYSNPGGVVETVLFLQEEGSGKSICIDVKDTGKGIKEEDRERIFQLRKRANGLVEPGSGLGLYLAREAARRQGGDVSLVSSKVNEGSTFRISLPYSAGELPETT
jgi:two-component system OmpR family sensor kinase